MSGEARKSAIYSSQLSKRGRSSMQAIQQQQQQQQQEEIGTELTKVNKEKQQLIEKKEGLASENARLCQDLKKLEEKNKSQRAMIDKLNLLNKRYKQEMTVAEAELEDFKARVMKGQIEITELLQQVEKLEKELTNPSKNPFEGDVTQHKMPSGMWLEDLSADLTDAEKQNTLNEESARREAQEAHEALTQLIRNNSKLN